MNPLLIIPLLALGLFCSPLVQAASPEDGRLGMSLLFRNNDLVVNYTLQNSPARRAGVKKGDIVHKIDGSEVKGKDLPDVVKALAGPSGTIVEVVIITKEQKEKTLKMVREKLVAAEVEQEKFPGNIIWITVFTPNGHAFTSALTTAISQQPAALVLDLRPSRSTSAEGFAAIGSALVGSDAVLWKSRMNGEGTPGTWKGSGQHLWKGPLAIVVDEQTFGIAEVMAAGLQNSGRAIIVGQQTKGSNAIYRRIPPQQGKPAGPAQLAGYQLTADGKDISGKGITPNLITPPEDDNYALSKKIAEWFQAPSKP